MSNLPILQPGDVLLYRGTSVFNWITRLKTWSDVDHVEVYLGRSMPTLLSCLASRPGSGVNLYPFRADGLTHVLRPLALIDMAAAWRWFDTVAGQPYDVIGLLNFYWAARRGRDNGAQFCSEFATRLQRAAGVVPFNDAYDADCVSPGLFLTSPAYTILDVTAGAHVGA